MEITNKKFVHYKKKDIKIKNKISNIKKPFKYLNIHKLNLNIRLNTLNNKTNFNTYNNTNSLNYLTLDKKLNSKNISTERLFSNKGFTTSRYNINNKIKIINKENTKDNKEFKKNIIKFNKDKIIKNNTLIRIGLTKNSDKKKFDQIYEPIINNNINTYNNYFKINNNISKTYRNNDSSNSSKKKMYNNMYKLKNQSLISIYKNRNKLKTFCNKKGIKLHQINQFKQITKNFQNSINYKTSYNCIMSNSQNKNKSNNFYCFSNKNKINNNIKLTNDNFYKREFLKVFNSCSIFNYNKEKKTKLKSEPKEINNIKQKNKKLISSANLIGTQKIKNKNIIIKKIKYYNLNNGKSHDNFQKENTYKFNHTKRCIYKNIKKNVKIKSKTNNNSITNKIVLKKKKIIKKNKSCEIYNIKFKKEKNKNYKLL